jgi:toxin-antitoxin system PIN domain toxin
MSFSVDVNILLYASDSGSPYYREAKFFIESCMEQEEVFYLGWPTIMGYLRIATHPSIFDYPLSPDEAMGNIEALISLPHVRTLGEGDDFWQAFRATADALPCRGNMVPDAHLAALLKLHGVSTLFTHDLDFLKFQFLDIRDPFPEKR